ncbi:MAG: UbiD family decarboxylase [Dehalococcoidia bacterium]
MAYRDNREFVAALEKTGDVVRIQQEVDWDLEAGAIIRRVCEMKQPAPFFERVKDYPGHRMFGAPLATFRRLAVAMGMDADSEPPVIQDEYERRMDNPIKPKVVSDGPCQENLILGDKVDMLQFPIPMIHEGDGGRYVGSWHMVVTTDPDTGWTNWGMYRMMVHNPRVIAGYMEPHQHQGLVYFRKYVPQNKPMPFAIAIGADPLSSLVASTAFRKDQDEADYAGALAQEPIELVKCHTNDLLVPAQSEIVLEGEVVPGTSLPEGPFGEYPGYRLARMRMSPEYRVKAITHRNNPILTISNPGMPQDDSHVGISLGAAVAVKRAMRAKGIPVAQVNWPPGGVTHLQVVSVTNPTREIIDMIEAMVLSSRTPICSTIIVDDDVDVFNMDEVWHAFVTKCHPLHGIRARESTASLTPYLSRQELNEGKGARVIFDCTWPADWDRETEVPPRISFRDAYTQETQDLVTGNWQSYGFK